MSDGPDDGEGPTGRTTADGERRTQPFDQARWSDDGLFEPLLWETAGRTVAVGSDAGGSEAGDTDASDAGTVDAAPDAGEAVLPNELTRDELTLPAPAEPQVARYFTRLSAMNYGVDSGPFPLGSCTMKYNPKFTEDLAALPDALVHPDRPDRAVQGVLAIAAGLQEQLARIGGMDAVSVQPPAGAAGEFAGILVVGAYHETNGEGHRDEIVVPAGAHGTNFASAAMAGYDVVELPGSEDGRVDLDALDAAVGEDTAALMLTNPNTLGLFERNIEAVAETVHDAGGLLYYDGANLNALLGRARPGDMGFDVMHYNLHKTFATPHGGGGPGAGPIGVTEELARFLPAPRVRPVGGDGLDGEASEGERTAAVDGGEAGLMDGGAATARDGGGRATAGGDDGATAGGDGRRAVRYERFTPTETVGKVHGFSGNWLVLLKAYAYIARLGDEGLCDASAMAVLNANYLASQIDYEVPYGPFHHEFVASAERDAADVAKRMLDHGVHPPTTKWPELVDEALMTEPTEAESKRSLDRLAAAFDAVREEGDEALSAAPERTTARRIDQAVAARTPRLSWQRLRDDDPADGGDGSA